MEQLFQFFPPDYIRFPQHILPIETEFFLYQHDFPDDREIREYLNEILTPYQRQSHSETLRALLLREQQKQFVWGYFDQTPIPPLDPITVAVLQMWIRNPRLIDHWAFGSVEPEPSRLEVGVPAEVVRFYHDLANVRDCHFAVGSRIRKGSNDTPQFHLLG